MKPISLILLVTLLLTGCASTTPQFKWTTDTGKRCFYTCKSNHATCYAGSYDIYGLAACDKAETYCILACPDVIEVTDTPDDKH